MKKITGFIIALLSTPFLFGQFSITGPSYPPSSPITCSSNTDPGVANFYDDGGAGANYSPNSTYTFTVCPDIPNNTPKIRATFGGVGLSWDVHTSDTLYVYDGPDATAPLLGKYNNGTDPTGFDVTASWENASGCLTFVFVSDGSFESTGWVGNIACFYAPQPFEIPIQGFVNGVGPNVMNPLDTGYVNLCQGDSVLLVAMPEFPNSFENTGLGYSQTPENVDYYWEFSDGSIGPNNDSVWFTPPNVSGYYVSLMVTDAYPHNTSTSCKIRVSTTPSFVGTGALEDTVCFGIDTELMGGVTTTDTVGVEIPGNAFQIGGEYAGLTFLPDGSNAEYTTEIHMSGFAPGSTVQTANDIHEVMVEMEHSFLGDLEMWLECPDGTTVTIFNANTGGSIPGGFGGGGTFLGEPVDGGTGPGNGYEYVFSNLYNTWGDFASTYTTNTIPTPPTAPSAGNTMNPNGVYEPEDDFSNLIGCPLNGDWVIHVKDNWAIDDGYIFSWSILFDPTLYPENETYQNLVVQTFWDDDPTIISGTTNDTNIVVSFPAPGTYDYTFNMIDDYGCAYDTTINVFVLDTLIETVTHDTSIFCYTDSVPLWSTATGTVPPFTFTWDNGHEGDTAIYSAMENGTFDYIVIATDACGFTKQDTATITVNQTLSIDSLIQNPADCGEENGWVSGLTSGATGAIVYKWWGPGADNPNSIDASVWQDKPSGWYYFTITDEVCTALDSVFLEQTPPPEVSFTATPQTGAAPLDVHFVNTSEPATSFDWYFGNNTDALGVGMEDQNTTYYDQGDYTVTLTAYSGSCSDQATKVISVYLPVTYDTPNVFTPNGDGDNDHFKLNMENAESFEISIVNRWGNVVFESTDPTFEWNGNIDNSGAECTDGTYFYTFTVKGKGQPEVQDHGFVQLFRGK